MSSFEALLKTVDTLTQDEVTQLYDYLVENRLQGSGQEYDSAFITARQGDDFGYEWSDEFWVNEE